MGVRVTIAGPGKQEIRDLVKDLKQAPKELRREAYRALEHSAEPLKIAARVGAQDYLPKAGGLAARVSTATIRAKLRGGKNPGLRLEASQTGVSAARFAKARSADKRAVRKRQKAFREAQGG